VVGHPLNVEALELESVQCALTAANAVGWDHVTEVRAELVAATSTRSRISESAAEDHRCFAAISGYFRRADGWLRTHANFPHHAAALSQPLHETRHK
jgi:hypothetical protein